MESKQIITRAALGQKFSRISPKLKKGLLSLLLASCTGLSAFAQANDWVLFPDYKMDASSGTVTQFPGGNNISSCTPSHGHCPGVLSNSSTGSYFAFSACGFFDNMGNNILLPGHGNMQPFEIPTNCEEFYAAGWRTMGSTYEFVLTRYSTAEGPLIQVGTSVLASYSEEGTPEHNYAVGRLEQGGWRRIFVTYYNNMEIFDIAPNGNVWHSWSGPLLQSSGGLLQSFPDNRMRMEMSADGKYLIYVSTTSGSTEVYMYDIYNNANILAGNFGSNIVSGVEYVPSSVLGAGQSPRLYVAHHGWTSYTGDVLYQKVGSGGWTSALHSSITNKEFYGFSEIELAKDGNLYLAYNPTANIPSTSGYYYCPNAGELVSLDPLSGLVTNVLHNGSVVPVEARMDNWGYIIQNQIDGENYSRPCHTEPCNSDFTASIDTRFPFDVNFQAMNSGQVYEWRPEPGQSTIGSDVYNYSYPAVSATHTPILKIVHPWDYCISGILLCLNQPRKTQGSPNVDSSNRPCSQSSDFVIDRRSTNGFDIGLSPISGSEPYYHISWGDGVTDHHPAPVSAIHTYTTHGTFNVCLQTGNGPGCKTCIEVCVPDPNGVAEDDGDGEKPGKNNKDKNGSQNVGQNSGDDIDVLATGAIGITPNPANNIINITAPGDWNDVRFAIINSLGVTVKSGTVNGKTSVDVSTLPSGIYTATTWHNGQPSVFKLVVQH